MNKIIKHLDKPLLIVSFLLFVLGLVMVFSASTVTAYMSHAVSPYNYFFKQLVFLLGGFLAATIMICIPLKVYDKYSNLAMVTVLIALALLPVLGVEVNDAKSWYDLKIFNLQPSEFMKIAIILVLSLMTSKFHKDKPNPKVKDEFIFLIKTFIIILIPSILTFLEPDTGAVMMYLALGFTILSGIEYFWKNRKVILESI